MSAASTESVMDTPTTDKFMAECHYNGLDYEDNFLASIEHGRKLERAMRAISPFLRESFLQTQGSGERFDAYRLFTEAMK